MHVLSPHVMCTYCAGSVALVMVLKRESRKTARHTLISSSPKSPGTLAQAGPMASKTIQAQQSRNIKATGSAKWFTHTKSSGAFALDAKPGAVSVASGGGRRPVTASSSASPSKIISAADAKRTAQAPAARPQSSANPLHGVSPGRSGTISKGSPGTDDDDTVTDINHDDESDSEMPINRSARSSSGSKDDESW
jgi:hypothetical protein